MESAAARRPNAPLVGPPVNVSPFIRFCRWSALLLGIGWGAMRYHQIRNKHQKIRVYEFEQEEIEKAQQAKIRALRNKEEMLALAAQAGLEITPELKAQLGIKDD